MIPFAPSPSGKREVHPPLACSTNPKQRCVAFFRLLCSTNRQLLLCGMHSGFIRVYPLQPGDHHLKSMRAYWTLSVHDNQYGHLKHIRCSYDDQFVLTAGDDGNIFSFSLRPPEERQRRPEKKKSAIPLPRVSLRAPIRASHTLVTTGTPVRNKLREKEIRFIMSFPGSLQCAKRFSVKKINFFPYGCNRNGLKMRRLPRISTTQQPTGKPHCVYSFSLVFLFTSLTYESPLANVVPGKLWGKHLDSWSVVISIETAKQKMELDSLHQKAKLKMLGTKKNIGELQKEFKQLLNLNESLPEHLQLTHEVHVHRPQE